MKKLLIISYLALAIVLIGEALRPTEMQEVAVTVKAGDSMWSICNEHYDSHSVECFNEFYSLNKEANGSDIHPGDVVTIRQEVYK